MGKRNSSILILSSICIPLFVIVGMLFFIAHTNRQKINPVDSVARVNIIIPKRHKSFPEIEIVAKAGIIYDTQNDKILFDKNSDEPLPLASLAKIMTALVAENTAPSYTLITLDKQTLNEEGDTGLRPQEIWKLQDLIDFTLTVSSNDGARAIATAIGAWQQGTTTAEDSRKYFLAMMNSEARELGLTKTSFANETGLDIDDKTSGAVGSALDIARLFRHILISKPETFSATRKENIEIESNSLLTHNATNTNEIIAQIPNLIASKTGYTTLAGGNLAVAFSVRSSKPNSKEHIVIAVALGSTTEGRFTDIEAMVRASRDYIINE